MSAVLTSSVKNSAPPRRECFVTIGATASFKALIDATLSPSFLSTLSFLDYTHLTVQCGPDLQYFNHLLSGIVEDLREGISIGGFDFNKQGLGQEMRCCKALKRNGIEIKEGLVICHAGAGTVLDGMRIGVPLVVVPNPSLLDNHQVELAEELEKQGYVTYGKLSDLEAAVSESEVKSQARTGWPPANSAERGVMGIVDEELGYESRMREILD